MNSYQNIPTNIISGFLGAGKTTAIKNLLLKKPASERWAVIVNEFGQVGIDGALLKNDNVEIKEIPGGCLCCVGSQAFNVGLNQIIRAVRPQRIIIEPTGLGHPAKLVESLSGEYYQSVLNLKAVINLLDARQLSDARYISHHTFIDQVMLADVLVANKADTYSEQDRQQFYRYAVSLSPAKDCVFMVEQAALELKWLDFPRRTERVAQFPDAHLHNKKSDVQQHNEPEASVKDPVTGWALIEGAMDGFYSIGWIMNSHFVFHKKELIICLEQIRKQYNIERIKGVMLTLDGGVSINITPGERAINPHGEKEQSILELTGSVPLPAELLDRQLKAQLF